MKLQFGFTMVELMIVIAVISVLSAIAVPQYSEYQARAKVAAGFGEISGAKAGFDAQLNEGNTNVQLTDVRMQSHSGNCEISIVDNNRIQCVLINAPASVSNKVVAWTRDAVTGEWTCTSTAPAHLSPKLCTSP